MSSYLPVTEEGYKKLTEEHERLKKRDLPDIIKKVAEARSHGDLKENAEYHAAREQQSWIQGRIEFLEDKIARSQIIKVLSSDFDTIIFGATVKVLDLADDFEEEFILVGAEEADAISGKISTTSPIGQALLGKKAGDTVTVNTPGGELSLKIVSFS